MGLFQLSPPFRMWIKIYLLLCTSNPNNAIIHTAMRHRFAVPWCIHYARILSGATKKSPVCSGYHGYQREFPQHHKNIKKSPGGKKARNECVKWDGAHCSPTSAILRSKLYAAYWANTRSWEAHSLIGLTGDCGDDHAQDRIFLDPAKNGRGIDWS